MNVLFVCSRNKWRSKTAEEIYKNSNVFSVRSAGTEPTAQRRISQNDIYWADLIFVMEKKHKQRILEKFSVAEKEIVILEIEDNYRFMDEELITEITTVVDAYLALI